MKPIYHWATGPEDCSLQKHPGKNPEIHRKDEAIIRLKKLYDNEMNTITWF